MVDGIRRMPAQYWMLVLMWIRSALAYPTSFVLMMLSTMLMTVMDFVAILLMFSHIDVFGGFTLAQMGLLYATASMTLGFADLATGSVEQVGQRIRTGTLDVYLIRPVPTFLQTAADQFALRRLGRPLQALIVLGFALGHLDLDWTVAKGIMLVVSVVAGSVIFAAIFVLGAAFQFIAIDSAELANSFTYGGQTLTQYPLAVFGKEIVRAVTFVVPLAFVNYYPVLFVLGKPAPLGLPSWIGLLSPLVAVVMVALAALAWRAGLRRYRSTGS
ncbi:ABC-2 type transport system permease protein [Kribbella amoyensis]|uniref:ABC-2 type transport system permease protein n=1 Tax=Kribbella amoyensis TaxID=996641 RepID=A0A561B6Z8_9ACTN|nr:ABC-2 family transporter protein [Kribbella amoyensis]TWD74755.1 ABC-2 type transport system permease protein [Kribbella amoyensis]